MQHGVQYGDRDEDVEVLGPVADLIEHRGFDVIRDEVLDHGCRDAVCAIDRDRGQHCTNFETVRSIEGPITQGHRGQRETDEDDARSVDRPVNERSLVIRRDQRQ